MKKLEAQFYSRCVQLAARVEEVLGWPRMRFLQAIDRDGPVEAVRDIIHSDTPSSTFTDLWEKGPTYLSLTLEALVVTERQWDDLFSDEDRAVASKRLRQHHWKPPSSLLIDPSA